MADRWIVSCYRFREHRSHESAITEADRLRAKTKKDYRIYRVKTTLRQSNAPELIDQMSKALCAALPLLQQELDECKSSGNGEAFADFDAVVEQTKAAIAAAAPEAAPDPAAPPWKCFFCGEVFHTPEAALEHFGDDGGIHSREPACVDPLRTDEKARLRELEEAYKAVEEALAERDAAQEDADAYHAQSAELERLFGKGRSTAHQAWLELDAMQGRVLAAEEKCRLLQREGEPL